jgi:hypothetical protein
VINGPLAQFYRFLAGATCCGDGAALGYDEADPLFDPARVPARLAPVQASTWVPVEDRGPHAAGVMTMPIFLLKYASSRQRAHAIYSAFLCHDFVAPTARLVPSNEPDLTRRPGCASCHRRLEPLSAYFARIRDSDWTYLPAAQFPVAQPRCAAADPAQMSSACRTFYDPAFSDAHAAELRGAHGDPAHTDAGPRGLAAEITASPEFASCVVHNVAQGLLGGALTPDDDRWQVDLARTLAAGGFRVRALVRAIVTSPRYREDPLPAPRRQMMPAEVLLRGYLTWFGGLTPEQVVQRAHGGNLFDAWQYYLAALGLPDYHVDAPRVSQSNTVMLAALGRIGEALCAHAASHDLHERAPLADRNVFAFEPVAGPTRAQFATGFDVLHRTFLGYPASLAPADRTDHYYALYRQVAARHPAGRLTGDETAWAAVCTALVQHPEAELY